MTASPEQFRVPGRRAWCLEIEGMGQGRLAGDPPAHPRPAQIRRAAQTHKPTGHLAAFGRDRQPPCGGKVEAYGVSPQFADDGRKAEASQALFHRPERVTGIPRLDMDAIKSGKARGVNSPRLMDRHAVLDPKQGLAAIQLRQQEAGPAAVARLTGKKLAKCRPGRPGQRKWFGQTQWFGAFSSRATSVAGDQGKTSSHTTRNAYVLLLFLFPRLWRESQGCDSKNYSMTTCAADSGPAAAIGFSAGGLPSISVRKVRISATTRLSAGRKTAKPM